MTCLKAMTKDEYFEDFFNEVKGYLTIIDTRELLRRAFEAGWEANNDDLVKSALAYHEE